MMGLLVLTVSDDGVTGVGSSDDGVAGVGSVGRRGCWCWQCRTMVLLMLTASDDVVAGVDSIGRWCCSYV